MGEMVVNTGSVGRQNKNNNIENDGSVKKIIIFLMLFLTSFKVKWARNMYIMYNKQNIFQIKVDIINRMAVLCLTRIICLMETGL